MRIETTTEPAPQTVKEVLLALEPGGPGKVFKQVKVITVRTTIQKLRPLYPERRYRTRTSDGDVTVWRLDDQTPPN